MSTSGSTGAPRIVEVPHLAVARLVFALEGVPIGRGSRILAAAPVSFDASTFELWGSLLRGGACVIHRGPLLDPNELRELVAEHGVTTAFLTTAVLALRSEADGA